MADCGDAALEELSEESLTSQFGELSLVTTAQLRLDTVRQGADCLGMLPPNLLHLKLTGSNISSLRDLGTGLAKLQVLWLGRCKLQDLGGLASLSELRELYLPFNDVADLSPLALHDSIEVLDLEGNAVADLDEVGSLWMCPELTELTLAGNPICKDKSWSRRTVVELLPQLRVLDDLPTDAAETTMKVDAEASQAEPVVEVPGFTHPLLLAALEAERGDALPYESEPDEEAVIMEQIKASLAGTSRPDRFSFGASERSMTEASSDLTCGSLLVGSPLSAARLRRRRGKEPQDADCEVPHRPLGDIRELLRQHWDPEVPCDMGASEEKICAQEEKQRQESPKPRPRKPTRPTNGKQPGQGRPLRKPKPDIDEVPEMLSLQRSASAGAEAPCLQSADCPKAAPQRSHRKALSRPPTSSGRITRCSSRGSRTFCHEPLPTRCRTASEAWQVDLPPVSVCFGEDGPFKALRCAPPVDGAEKGIRMDRAEALGKLDFGKATFRDQLRLLPSLSPLA